MNAGALRLQQLIAVAMEGSQDNRRALLREITDIFIAAPNQFAPAALQHIDAILSRLAKDADARLRQEIAEKLADAPNAPRGLMRQLARDEITVAEPVLKRSQALSDEDLLGVMRQRGPDHLHAITKRRELSQILTAELAARGDRQALINLARNLGAKFSNKTMAKMVAHARAVKSLQGPMTERFDLPAPLLTRLYFFAPPPIKREIVKRSGLFEPALIDELITANRRKIADHAPEDATPDQTAAYRLIHQKAAAGEINERFLAALLGARRKTAFVIAFAHSAGVDISTAQTILKGKSGEALAIACRAAGFERATFKKAFASLHPQALNAPKAPRIFGLYEKIPEDAAKRIMRFWIMRSQSQPADDSAPVRRRPKLHELAQRRAG